MRNQHLPRWTRARSTASCRDGEGKLTAKPSPGGNLPEHTGVLQVGPGPQTGSSLQGSVAPMTSPPEKLQAGEKPARFPGHGGVQAARTRLLKVTAVTPPTIPSRFFLPSYSGLILHPGPLVFAPEY